MEIDNPEYKYYLLPAADLRKEIDRLRENMQAVRDQHMYTLARFNNYRRRVAQNGNPPTGEAKRETLLPLLDILDGLENALQFPINNGQTLKQSMQIAHQKLLLFLESQRFLSLQSTANRKNPNGLK